MNVPDRQTVDNFGHSQIPGRYLYRRVGYDERPVELKANGTIGEGAADCERKWQIDETPEGKVISIIGVDARLTCHLTLCENGVLRGDWLIHEKMPVELIPTSKFSTKYHHPSDSRPDWSETYYVGIPTLKRHDLLEKCIESILLGTALPRAIFVVDNSDQSIMPAWNGHSSRRVRIIRPPTNLGVARSWNVLHRMIQPAPLIICNDDIEIGKNLFEKMLETDSPFVTASHSIEFCVFLLRNEIWQSVGEFDETFWPAYYEDNDYDHRARLAGYQSLCPESDGFKNNGPSATHQMFNSEERKDFNSRFRRGYEYYITKWGGPPHAEAFKTPFNK